MNAPIPPALVAALDESLNAKIAVDISFAAKAETAKALVPLQVADHAAAQDLGAKVLAMNTAVAKLTAMHVTFFKPGGSLPA